KKLGTVEDKKDERHPEGTDMHSVEDNTPGVLQIEIRGGAPDGGPVTTGEQSIVSLSDVTRAKLEGKTIKDLKLPILAKGYVKWRDPLGNMHYASEIRIGRNELEHDQYMNSGSKIPDGVDWLRARASVDEFGDPSKYNWFTPDQGAEVVFK